nr:FeoA domain-containing protein [uncultured Acetatifactor sp.]
MKMTLYEAQKGHRYCIEGLYVEPAITRRLQALGLNDGTIVNILNRKKHGALIVQVRGTRLALGKHISSSIEISDIGENKETEGGRNL